jgi:hypothetical protein
MSDILITNLPNLEVTKVQDYLSWTSDHVFYSNKMSEGVQFVQSHLKQPDYWKYFTSDNARLTCLVAGRLVLDSQIEALNNLDECISKFSIAKYFLNEWVTHDESKFSKIINGAGILFIYDEDNKELNFWTDCLGFYPIYFWSSNEKFIISSNIDLIVEILDSYSIQLKVDKLTIAEFLMTGTASQPYTYWTDIKQLDSGMLYKLKVNSCDLSHKKYWQPPFRYFSRNNSRMA